MGNTRKQQTKDGSKAGQLLECLPGSEHGSGALKEAWNDVTTSPGKVVENPKWASVGGKRLFDPNIILFCNENSQAGCLRKVLL